MIPIVSDSYTVGSGKLGNVGRVLDAFDSSKTGVQDAISQL